MPKMQILGQEENLKRRREGSGEGGNAGMDIRDYGPPQDGFAGANLIQSASRIKRASPPCPAHQQPRPTKYCARTALQLPRRKLCFVRVGARPDTNVSARWAGC